MIYRNLFILMFGVFSILNTELGIIPILPKLSEVAGVSIEKTGILIATFALTVCFIGPFINLFAHSINKKRVLITGQILLLLCNSLMILFPNFYVMIFARFLGGLGHPLFFAVALSYPSYEMPLEKRARGLAIINLGINLAFILGFPVISFLSFYFVWQSGFIFSIIVNILSIMMVLIFIPSNIGQNESGERSQYSFKDKGFILSLPALISLFAGVFIMYSYFSPYLLEIGSLDTNNLTIAVMLFGIFGFIGNILIGIISPSSPVKSSLRVGILFMICFILLYNIGSYSHLFIFMVVSLWGFLQVIMSVVFQLWYMTNKTTSIEAVNTSFLAGSNLGITLGSFFGGLAIPYLGIQILPAISTIVIFIVIGLIVLDTLLRQKKV